MPNEEMKRVAILIDAENVAPVYAEQIFEKAGACGDVVCKELFGEASAISTWIVPILKYAIHTNLSVRTTKGKNTSDIALTIGAMDILTKENVDVMVIVSSDSDFSPLAIRLRESGVMMVGMGTDAVNPLWKIACSEFVTLEADKPAEKAKPEKKDSRTPEERREIVWKAIEEKLMASGGKVAAPNLFLELNPLHDYWADKKASGFKKATQYLTGVFGDRICLTTGEGKTWVCVKNTAEEKPEENVQEQNKPAQNDIAQPEKQDAEREKETQPEENLLALYLIGTGLDEKTAETICRIADECGTPFKTYGRLRSQFGNPLGTDYYHRVRDYNAAALHGIEE